ncbi:MAG: hypothetical protein MJZ05_07820 [Fibrobacter sp.]|nr:hypothetical protein [Fibrobacter sp.]
MNKVCCLLIGFVACLLVSCAGERQGLVCEEIEYRLNTMTYSPDQRAYMEEELRTCRDEEAQKKGADAATRQSIYDRYAASDTTSKDSVREISVSEALQDSSGVKTESIYDRYSNKNGENAPDTSANDVSNFQ